MPDPTAKILAACFGLDSGPNWEGPYRDLMDAITADVFTVARAAFRGRVAPCDVADPYPTWEAMREAAEATYRHDGAPFKVSRVKCNHPHLSSTENYLWRVHHDAMHVLSDAPAFTWEGELETFRYTVERLGLESRALAALTADLVGQAAWFEAHGEFPTDCHNVQRVPASTWPTWADIGRSLL